MENATFNEAIIYASLIYILAYRLAILLLGGLCIFWGYRLFTLGFGHIKIRESQQEKASPTNGPEMEAKFGNIQLILRNSAPGIFFAAFGSIIVVVILMGSPPSFTSKESWSTSPPSTSKGDMGESQHEPLKERKITIRDKDVRPKSAREAHHMVGEYVAEMMRLEERAVMLDPDNGKYQDSLASIFFITNRFQQALKHQRKAEQLLPDDQNIKHRLSVYEQIVKGN